MFQNEPPHVGCYNIHGPKIIHILNRLPRGQNPLAPTSFDNPLRANEIKIHDGIRPQFLLESPACIWSFMD